VLTNSSFVSAMIVSSKIEANHRAAGLVARSREHGSKRQSGAAQVARAGREIARSYPPDRLDFLPLSRRSFAF
jgi:hypothetical protein